MKKTLTAAAVSSALVLGLASSALALHDTATAETATVVKGTSKVTIDGSVRERGYYRKDNITGPTGDNDRSATAYDSRIQLGVNAKVSDTATGYLQLESGQNNGDVDQWGTGMIANGGLSNGGQKLGTPSILQAWINYQPASWGIKAGHMPLALGNKVFFDHTGSGDDAIVAYANLGDATHVAALAIKFDEQAVGDNSDDLDGYVGLVTHKLSDSLNLGLNVTYLKGGDTNMGFTSTDNTPYGAFNTTVIAQAVSVLPADNVGPGWSQTVTQQQDATAGKVGIKNFSRTINNVVQGNGSFVQTITDVRDGAKTVTVNQVDRNTAANPTQTVTVRNFNATTGALTGTTVTQDNFKAAPDGSGTRTVTATNAAGMVTNQTVTTFSNDNGTTVAFTPLGTTPLTQPVQLAAGQAIPVAFNAVPGQNLPAGTTLFTTAAPDATIVNVANAAENFGGLSMTNVGLTADGKVGAISYMADLEMQFGTFSENNFGPTSDANGWAMKLGADYDLGAGKVGLVFGYGSGDEFGSDPDQDQFINFLTDTTYDTIVAGYRGIIPSSFNGGLNSGLSNLTLYQLKGSAKTVCPMTGKDLSLLGTLSYMLLSEDTVTYWTYNGNGLNPNWTPTLEDEVGTEIDVIATWALSAGLNYKVEAGYLFTGDAYKTAASGPGSDPEDEVFLRHSLDLKF